MTIMPPLPHHPHVTLCGSRSLTGATPFSVDAEQDGGDDASVQRALMLLSPSDTTRRGGCTVSR